MLGASHAQLPEDTQTSIPVPLLSRRSKEPLNEYAESDRYLYGNFWYLFPLQQGLEGHGILRPAQRRHLLTQFHNVFATDLTFLFLIANQVQRVASARSVALRLRNNPESFRQFEDMVANRSFLND